MRSSYNRRAAGKALQVTMSYSWSFGCHYCVLGNSPIAFDLVVRSPSRPILLKRKSRVECPDECSTRALGRWPSGLTRGPRAALDGSIGLESTTKERR
ncbi:hypothetical protein K491DRAFT_269635 [Lophiostoma macrostomum CBS 122681]|uniref:Uncharacterized protein n=1 Tax=Lophiostoma macrostomum CBS 122681 TaxID=1314788 RepID=A0A6A6TEL2_9PLEO|nr:hypothetical protein K491DRAFT_269635 [Lophiostoma macrostomum CBS 122681]